MTNRHDARTNKQRRRHGAIAADTLKMHEAAIEIAMPTVYPHGKLALEIDLNRIQRPERRPESTAQRQRTEAPRYDPRAPRAVTFAWPRAQRRREVTAIMKSCVNRTHANPLAADVITSRLTKRHHSTRN